MSKVVITQDVLSKLVREVLDGKEDTNEGPANVNPIVDPSAAVTEPINPSFTPQNRTEMGVALKDLVKAIPNDKIPALYKNIKDVVEDVPELTDEQEKAMKKQNDKTIKSTQAVETFVRDMVRTALKEAEWRDPADVQADEDPEEQALDADAGSRKAYKSTAIGGMHDVGGASFEQIAKDVGMSVAGAKQAVDKALKKARYFAEMDEDDREIFTLQAMVDYIDQLNRTGELTPADVQLMKDHPDIVRTLDGFREYLDKQFRRAVRKGDMPAMPGEGEDDQEG